MAVDDPQPTADVSAKNFFHGTGFPGGDCIFSWFTGTSTLFQDITGPMGKKGLEISIKQLMKTKLDDRCILYSSAAWRAKDNLGETTVP